MVSAISLVPDKVSFLLKVKNVDDFRLLLFVIISLVTIKSCVALRHILVKSSLVTEGLKMCMSSRFFPLGILWPNVGSCFPALLVIDSVAGDAFGDLSPATSRDKFLFRFKIGDKDIRRGVNTLFGTKLNLTIFSTFRGTPP